MDRLNWLLLLFLLWASFFIPLSHQLQTYQAQLLMQLRKHLEYPQQLDIWENYNGDLCNLSSTPSISIACKDNLITELKIMGGMKLTKVSDSFTGSPIQNQTLSASFSIDSFVTTLTRLTTLKAICFVSLGIWGPLPGKIHRLRSLELLDLSSNFIFGSVPAQISRMVNLTSLVLGGNYFNGTLPDWFDSLSRLTVLSLKSNRFEGEFPSSVRRIRTLTDIALSHNQLSGKLPDLTALTNLHVLDLRDNNFQSNLPPLPKGLVTVLLSNNSFSGEVPSQFGQLSHLQHLDLSSNNLSGIPPASLFSLPSISYLNLASNVFSGSLPINVACGSKLGFVDISMNKLTGGLPSCLENKRVVKSGGNCLAIHADSQHQESFCKEAKMVTTKNSRFRAVGILVAVVTGALVLMGIFTCGVVCICRRNCRPRKKFEHNIVSKVVLDNSSSTNPPAAGFSSDVLANARFISQTAKLGTQGSPACRVFSLEELKEATNFFHSSSFMGEGSSGKVYKGRLHNGNLIAIRSLTLFKRQSIQNLRVRLELLSKLHHPHLVTLLGHCIDSSGQDDSNKVFLVYEYVPNGNYRSHLAESFTEKALRWPDRLAILIGVARAVQYLHTGVLPGTFNNRLKTNNILLDEHQIAKLSDYGMPIITEEFEKLEAKGEGMKSSYRMNLEDDVYNFGFILLESLVGPIVTGKGETFLLNEMASFGSQDGRRRIVDPIVLTTCSQESLSIVVSITSKCISPEPSARPSFEDVLWNLQYAAQVQATADADQKSDSTS
ncbi:unnamed protein product [Linum trigynum]|uniref:Protein kinase domain-containing protein n=1 Tax=Linum trigynum TaxID=586398 RepID=A0AAV2F028_9ROSI